jgi:hypothetical protein
MGNVQHVYIQRKTSLSDINTGTETIVDATKATVFEVW